jgi:hypothetical protein
MARYLGSHLDRYPEGRAPLTILALEDASSQVRRYAAAAVTGDRHD